MNQLGIQDLSITVIEPSSVQGGIITQHLENLGIRSITLVNDGRSALAQIQQFLPDLIISTMYLPDMSATEVLETLRNQPETESIAFMLISSETSFAMLDPLRQAGIIAILPKPFTPKDLSNALNSAIEFIDPDNHILDEIQLEDLSLLVVDDSALARKHISRVLNGLGIETIQQACDGKEAIKLIEKNFYDLIVTDYNMPEMDGEELTRYIRDNSSQRTIPVLMVTSEENESRLAAVQQAGVSGICDKPFDTSTVRDLIYRILKDAET
ncbi:MAG: response regulator [Gammaproteobacteria bacterium]|nr:response regulator [Gammaproteobacteria bacterium]